MNIHILSIVPELLESPFGHSIMKRAANKGLLNITVHHLRNWAVNEHGMVDDYQFGGGAGMVMMCEPLVKAIEELNATHQFGKDGGATNDDQSRCSCTGAQDRNHYTALPVLIGCACGMKITVIKGVKPIAPTIPDQSRIDGLKRQKDTAARNLKAERERQKLKKAQISLAGIGAG